MQTRQVDRRFARLKRLAPIAAAIAVLGCQDMVAPSPEPAIAIPEAPQLFTDPVGDVVASGRLGAPFDNLGTAGAIGWSDFGEVSTATGWVEIRTTGEVHYIINQATYDAPCGIFCIGWDAWPYWGEGYAGGDGTQGKLRVNVSVGSVSSTGDGPYHEGNYVVENGQRTILVPVNPGDHLWASRTGMPGARNCFGCPNDSIPVGPFAWYHFEGGHDVQARAVTPVQIAPNRAAFRPGDTITWTSSLYPGMMDFQWRFKPKYGPSDWVPECRGNASCSMVPPDSGGTMELFARWQYNQGGIAIGSSVVEPDAGCGSNTGGARLFCQSHAELSLICNGVISNGTSSPRVEPVRGDRVDCHVEADVVGADLRVLNWRFTDYASLEVRQPGPQESWGGPAVAWGDITVDAILDGEVRSLSVTVFPKPRGWSWGLADWQFKQNGPHQCVSGSGLPELNERWGWNTRTSGCSSGRLEPDLSVAPNAGYTVAVVPPGGPNAGVWYVTSATFGMNRVTGMLASVTPGGMPLPLKGGPQSAFCHSVMHGAYHQPTGISFFSFNVQCQGNNLNAMYQGIWLHEGFGSTGVNGHESQARLEAQKVGNDPNQTVEELVGPTEAQLRNTVANSVAGIDANISIAGSNHAVVNGNWIGPVWVWNPASQLFVNVTINNI